MDRTVEVGGIPGCMDLPLVFRVEAGLECVQVDGPTSMRIAVRDAHGVVVRVERRSTRDVMDRLAERFG